jgi:hypothetical protein
VCRANAAWPRVAHHQITHHRQIEEGHRVAGLKQPLDLITYSFPPIPTCTHGDQVLDGVMIRESSLTE